MLLLVIGLTFATSVLGIIPAYNPKCIPNVLITDACVYGNLTVSLFSKTLKPNDCNGRVDIKEFTHAPVIHINSTNTTDRFTVVMTDLGPRGRGPDYLEWMVTNVSITTLPNVNHIPPLNVLAGYQQPLLMPGQNSQTLIQILVFRHQNVLRVPFGELYVTVRRNFSLRQLISNISPNLRLCGPVAGAQYWLTSENHAPSAPPAPSHSGGSLQGPVYVPVVPAYPVPVGSAPAAGNAPPSNPAPSQPASVPSQQQPAYTTFHKKSSGSVSQPIHTLFVPLVILTVMCL